MSWLSRLSNVFRSERLDHALDEEMRFHLESRTEALIAGGVPAEQAALEARRSLGNQLTYREASHDIRLLAGLESIIRDLRYGVRSLRRAPGFTVVASLTLALGIGAATAVFSVVNGVLIKPLPYPDSEALVSIWHMSKASNNPGEVPISATQFFTYRDENRMFAAFGLWWYLHRRLIAM